jgi:hypothetical protein
MGRYSGKITTAEAQRLELSYLLKAGIIQKGNQNKGFLAWNNGHIIKIQSDFSNQNKKIRLAYQIESSSGKLYEMDYYIQLESIPSNLGRGEVFYFKCPISGQRSRILYLAYGSPIFKARQSYQIRIFYHSQICSKNEYHKERMQSLDTKIQNLESKIRKSHYRGKETRLKKRISKLRFQMNQHDLKSFIQLAFRLGLSPQH